MQNATGLFFSFYLFVACLFGFWSTPQAQVKSGVIWESVPHDLVQKIDVLENYGVNKVFLPLNTPMTMLQEVSIRGFEVVLVTGNKWNFSSLHSQIPERLLLLSNNEVIKNSLVGVVIASHPNLNSDFITSVLLELEETIENELDIQAYIITHQNPALNIKFFLQFNDQSRQVIGKAGAISSFTEFNSRLLHDYLILNTSPNSTVIFNADKLVEALKEDSEIGRVLAAFKESSNPLVSLPPIPQQRLKVNLPALFLASVLVVFLFVIKLFHVYSTSLLRYFLGHKFFLNDIFERHYRFGISAFIVFVLMAVVPALSLVVFFEFNLSQAGRAFLAYYLPLLETQQGVFVFGVIIMVLLNALLISWIASASIRSEIVAQSATLLLWPQHVSLLLFSIAMLLAANGIGIQFIPWFVALIFLIPLVSFLVASISFSFRPSFSLPVHLLLTIVLFGFVTGLVVWIVTYIFEVDDIVGMLHFLM